MRMYQATVSRAHGDVFPSLRSSRLPIHGKVISAMETTMTAIETADASLSWNVLTIRRPGLTRDLPAGKEELMWVANSSTLIHGERDAVLVDTFLTTEQSQKLC
jgi:hypothetical protein